MTKSPGNRRSPERESASSISDELPGLWGRRGFWQIRLRWAVAPLMVVAVLAGRALGFEFHVLPILLIAAASPLYNAVFAWIFSRYEERLEREPRLERIFTMFEVVADYTAMFLLIFFTGGVSSPLALFLIFHVILAAIQFRRGTAYKLAGFAAGGLWLMLLGQAAGWLPILDVTWRGERIVHLSDRPAYAVILLLVLTATLFLTAGMVARIMKGLRRGVRALASANEELSRLNRRLEGLYAMVAAFEAERRLQPILDTVADELAAVIDVPAVAVKLLSEDGKTLRYVAAHGLPDELVAQTVIHVERSPLNRRVLDGETLVHGRLGDNGLQLQQELRALGIRSAALAPLKAKDRVIGVLGIYSHSAERFDDRDTDFLRLAAELLAIAIEDARANEEVERLMQERAQFTLEVAHNLRAPLGAGISMLDLVRDGDLGEVNARQAEYLERVDKRLRSLMKMIGDLLTIGRTLDWSREIPDVVVDLADLARQTEATFRDEAASKGLRFAVVCEDDVPAIDSGADLLRQVMENLVSNAIKYTPEGGEVDVRFARLGEDEVRITVRDTGIGIPAAEQHRLFKEFFRASNARKASAAGTGLGLALVKQTVERHSGRIRMASAEDQGTTVVVDLPIRQTAGGVPAMASG